MLEGETTWHGNHPRSLIYNKFFIDVKTSVFYYIFIPRVYNSESTVEKEEFTPPTKTYREDCCVVCLESKPNILYFDCLHIAICDSCDRLKKTGRNNCDVCRSEISKRVKI